MIFSDSSPRQVLLCTMTSFSPTSRLVLSYMDSCPRKYIDCLWSCERIAEAVGCSVRAVQAAIQAAELAGLIEVIKDTSLRVGRRLRLLWRLKPLVRTEEVADVPAVELCSPVVLPGPGQVAAAAPRPLRAAAPTEAPVPPEDDRRGEGAEAPTRAATREEVDEVARKASAEFRVPRREVVKAARRAGRLSWVPRAMSEAKKSGARGWGLVLRILDDWRETGGPPPDRRELARQKRQRREAFIDAHFGASGHVSGVEERPRAGGHTG